VVSIGVLHKHKALRGTITLIGDDFSSIEVRASLAHESGMVFKASRMSFTEGWLNTFEMAVPCSLKIFVLVAAKELNKHVGSIVYG